jgi:hypothetical protein
LFFVIPVEKPGRQMEFCCCKVIKSQKGSRHNSEFSESDYPQDNHPRTWQFEEDDGVFDETSSTDYLRKVGTLVRLISDKMPSVGGVIIAGIPLEGPQLGQSGDHAESIIP